MAGKEGDAGSFRGGELSGPSYLLCREFPECLTMGGGVFGLYNTSVDVIAPSKACGQATGPDRARDSPRPYLQGAASAVAPRCGWVQLRTVARLRNKEITMRKILICCLLLAPPARATDNELTAKEKADGWVLLFDGKTLDGWMTSSGKESKTPVEHASINPHQCGGYMMVHKKQWDNYLLSLDFKISTGCNSGIFIRTASLKARPGKDVGFNGMEVAIDDTRGAGYHDTGAIYDLVKPVKQAQTPVGQWNHIVITSNKNVIAVELNGVKVTRMDVDEFKKPNLRPDGTKHKFDIAYKDHPRKGYIGLQDHGSPCWFKNIKIKPLK
jgi:hypothetical protein